MERDMEVDMAMEKTEGIEDGRIPREGGLIED